jgi:hypothetical protein
MFPDEKIRIEIPRSEVWSLDTEQQVVDNLAIDRRTGKAFWSKPVVRLLVTAGQAHPTFLDLIPQAAVER